MHVQPAASWAKATGDKKRQEDEYSTQKITPPKEDEESKLLTTLINIDITTPPGHRSVRAEPN